MFEALEFLEQYFDEWYEKGYLWIALGLGGVALIYFIIRALI